MTITSVVVEYTTPVSPILVGATVEAALGAWPLPTGPAGDMTQITGATLSSDTPGLGGGLATRTLTFVFPSTTVAASSSASGTVATTVPLAISAGAQTVQPLSMTNIVLNSVLTIDADNPALTEQVTVTAVAGNTFTATFANAHNPNADVESDGSQVVTPGSMANIYGPVNTTVALSVAAGTHAVTPASMQNIVAGEQLVIDQGNPLVEEVVTVASVTATTFTATYANPHAAGFQVTRPGSQLLLDSSIFSTTFSIPGVVVGTSIATPVAMGPIAVGMLLSIHPGTATAEIVKVTAITATTFTAKFKFAHAGGEKIYTVSSVPGTNPENVNVSVVTATTFTAVLTQPHAATWNVTGIVNSMFPGYDPTEIAGAFASLYQPLLANAVSSPVTAVAPVVTLT